MSVRASIAADTVTPRACAVAAGGAACAARAAESTLTRGSRRASMAHGRDTVAQEATRRGPGVPVLPHQGEDRGPVPASRSRTAQRPPQDGGRGGARLRRHVQLVRRAARRPGRLAAGDRRHLGHGEPHRQRPCASPRRCASGCPDALLVAGGPLPTVFPDRFLPHVDVVFRGEADVELPRVLPRLPGARSDAGDDRRPAARRSTPAWSRTPAARASPTPPVHHSQEEIAALSAARPRRLRPPRLPARVGAHRPPSDDAARDPGLSLRL